MTKRIVDLEDTDAIDPAANRVERQGGNQSQTESGVYIDPASIPGGTGGLPRNPDGSERK